MIDELEQTISQILGLNFTLQQISEPSDTQIFTLRPEFPEYPYGFIVKLTFFWKRLEIELILDSYASQLLLDMEQKHDSWETFCILANKMKESSNEVRIKINDIPQNLKDSSTWPTSWSRISIIFIKYGIDFQLDQIETLKYHIQDSVPIFNLFLTLMPLEENDRSPSRDLNSSEGNMQKIQVNRYERNPRNRLSAITLHGLTCKICGFNFEEKYGLFGIGFIHIHHIVPVSEIDDSYQLSIADDLIPVCPNCHAIIHRRKPYLSVEDMKKMLR
jgi:5-methylcytosine-specific restriction enzyme A